MGGYCAGRRQLQPPRPFGNSKRKTVFSPLLPLPGGFVFVLFFWVVGSSGRGLSPEAAREAYAIVLDKIAGEESMDVVVARHTRPTLTTRTTVTEPAV